MGRRGDGAFGQFCIVLPELDAVVAVTGGTRDMARVMNLVWDKLLPEMRPGRLPEDAAARRKLEEKLKGLTVRYQTGRPASALAAKVSGRWYEFPENGRGIKALAFDFRGDPPALLVRTAAGETRTPVGFESWAKSRGGFANGLERALGVPARPLSAASGAWTGEDTYSLKLVLYETPYHSTLTFKFEGDRLLLDSEHNVWFGPTKQPQLIGRAARYCVTTVPILTTSKSEPLMPFRVFSSESFQRGSGAPLTYQLLPLSARIIPYFFSARRMTCIAGE